MVDSVSPVSPAAERMRRFERRRRAGLQPTRDLYLNATAAYRPGAADLARRAPTPMRAGTAPAMLGSMRRT